MNIVVDYYKDENLEQVNNVLKEAFNVEKNNFSGEEFKEIVAKYNGDVVGYLVLMEFAEDIAREDNAMYLQLTCSTHRVAAHRLYERCGYIKRDSDQFRKVLE